MGTHDAERGQPLRRLEMVVEFFFVVRLVQNGHEELPIEAANVHTTKTFLKSTRLASLGMMEGKLRAPLSPAIRLCCDVQGYLPHGAERRQCLGQLHVRVMQFF